MDSSRTNVPFAEVVLVGAIAARTDTHNKRALPRARLVFGSFEKSKITNLQTRQMAVNVYRM